MIDNHEDAVDKFEEEMEDGKNKELVQFAASTLPTLKEHLKAAKQIDDDLDK